MVLDACTDISNMSSPFTWTLEKGCTYFVRLLNVEISIIANIQRNVPSGKYSSFNLSDNSIADKNMFAVSYNTSSLETINATLDFYYKFMFDLKKKFRYSTLFSVHYIGPVDSYLLITSAHLTKGVTITMQELDFCK